MSSERDLQLSQARSTFHNIVQISQLLSTGLDNETLTLCVRLCELGINPEALATVILELRRLTKTHDKPGD